MHAPLRRLRAADTSRFTHPPGIIHAKKSVRQRFNVIQNPTLEIENPTATPPNPTTRGQSARPWKKALYRRDGEQLRKIDRLRPKHLKGRILIPLRVTHSWT